MTVFPQRRRIALLTALMIFCIEIAIATFAPSGSFLRTSIGDILVIALIYFFLRGLAPWSQTTALGLSVSAGFLVELLQYAHAGERLGVNPGSIPGIMLGSTFSVRDLIMYCIGGALSWAIDRDTSSGELPGRPQQPR